MKRKKCLKKEIMVRVLTIESEFKSARRLGLDTYTRFDSNYVKDYDDDIILRWGCSSLYQNEEKKSTEFRNVINSAASIAFNCQKHDALKRLSAFVDTPKIYDREIPAGKFAVLRPVNHSCGRGFNVVQGPRKIEKGYYATGFINTNFEYRVWVANGHYLCARRVAPKNYTKQKFECRSEHLYKFCKMPTKLGRLVSLAFRAIGLEMGAADILKVKRKFFFTELNTACSIDHKLIREFFQKHIPQIIKERYDVAVKPLTPDELKAKGRW